MTFRPYLDVSEKKFEYLDSNLLEHKHNEHTDQSNSCCSIHYYGIMCISNFLFFIGIYRKCVDNHDFNLQYQFSYYYD